MNRADSGVLKIVRDLWWKPFVENHKSAGPEHSLDTLDAFMNVGRDQLMRFSNEYAGSKGFEVGTDEHRQRASQYIKSNTGKAFERFVGLALAYSLSSAESRFCVQPFRKKEINRIPGMNRDDFKVTFVFGNGSLFTHIDADLFVVDPEDSQGALYLVSVKSTLKDRFHNVPYWNLLRHAAVSDDFPGVKPAKHDVLSQLKYVAVCSDLAKEQPDFGSDKGARNLLQVDASLLDGAYVTASKAKGLPDDCTDSLGDIRQHAFYRYSCFYKHLIASGR